MIVATIVRIQRHHEPSFVSLNRSADEMLKLQSWLNIPRVCLRPHPVGPEQYLLYVTRLQVEVRHFCGELRSLRR